MAGEWNASLGTSRVSMDLAGFVQAKVPSSVEIDPEYLKRLTGVPQGQLETERNGILSKQATIRDSQRSLAEAHMSDFIDAKTAMKRLSRAAQELSRSSKSSVEASLAVPRIPEKSYSVLKELLSNDFVVYAQIDKVQELFSLPELVKDCVLTGNYDSALELAGMMDRLKKRYPQSQLVAHLVNEVQNSVNGMREIFLESLREASRLPLLTRSVAFLQRLEFPNLESVFLSSRRQYIEDQWDQIPPQMKRTQPLAFLKRVVEIYREHVFATINGYHTIFNEDARNAAADKFGLALFSRQVLVVLLGHLKEHAPKITDASDRTTLWLQLAFCANSLGRIGADFWPFLDSSILTKAEWEEASRLQKEMASKVTKLTTHKPLHAAANAGGR